MRLFVALIPPAEIVDEVVAAIGSAQTVGPTLRWVRREQLHLTLAFLGEVGDDALRGLTARLHRVANRHASVTLSFAGGGRFGDRVLWTRVHGDREQLRRLAESVAAAARRSGISIDDRPYRPHLTLARSREPVDLRPPVAALGAFAGSSWTAEQLHLVRSHLGRVATYETLYSWPLAGRNPHPS